MSDAPGTCHLVGCPGKGTRDEHVSGCVRACNGTWPGGQPFHVKGCPNDGSRFPDPEPAKVQLDQEQAVVLLDWIAERQTKHLLDLPAAAVHALSRGLAVARNTQREAVR